MGYVFRVSLQRCSWLAGCMQPSLIYFALLDFIVSLAVDDFFRSGITIIAEQIKDATLKHKGSYC